MRARYHLSSAGEITSKPKLLKSIVPFLIRTPICLLSPIYFPVRPDIVTLLHSLIHVVDLYQEAKSMRIVIQFRSHLHLHLHNVRARTRRAHTIRGGVLPGRVITYFIIQGT